MDTRDAGRVVGKKMFLLYTYYFIRFPFNNVFYSFPHIFVTLLDLFRLVED